MFLRTTILFSNVTNTVVFKQQKWSAPGATIIGRRRKNKNILLRIPPYHNMEYLQKITSFTLKKDSEYQLTTWHQMYPYTNLQKINIPVLHLKIKSGFLYISPTGTF